MQHLKEYRQALPPLWLLVFVSGLGPISMNGVLPANNAIMQELVASQGQIQLLLTLYLLSTLLAQPFLGNWADRVGRRPVAIFGLLVFALGSAIAALAPSIEWLLLGRAAQGAGSAACMAIPRTIVRDVYPRNKAASVIGYLTTAMMVVPMIGPAICGWITDATSWRWVHALLAVLGLLAALGAYVKQHETRPPRPEGQQPVGFISASRTLFAAPGFLGYCLLLCGSVGLYFGFISSSPYIMMNLRGHSASSYGSWFAVVAVGYISGNLLAGRFSSTVGTTRMLKIGVSLACLAVVGFWVLSGIEHPLGLFAPMFLVAMSNGMSIPNVNAAALGLVPHLAGNASGLLGVAYLGMGVLLSFVLAALLGESATPLYLSMTICIAIAIVGLKLVLEAEDQT
ncbi:MAG: multidrug effflux MFS transporter [Granulosicoccaceae bacterium]